MHIVNTILVKLVTTDTVITSILSFALHKTNFSQCFHKFYLIFSFEHH